jgi:hypothetical protein
VNRSLGALDPSRRVRHSLRCPLDGYNNNIIQISRILSGSLGCLEGHFTHEIESLWPLHLKHSHWWKRRSRSKFASHYAWGTNGACECKMDVKSTWIPTRRQMDHVPWSLRTIFKNHHLEVGLTQNQGTMALRTLTTAGLFYFIMCENPHK